MRYKNSLMYQVLPQKRLINETEFFTDENLDDDGLLCNVDAVYAYIH